MRRYRLRALVVVCACLVAGVIYGQTTAWRDVYKVKKKDTIYGIAQNYGLTVEELMEANPEMRASSYVLKKGSLIFIPFAQAVQQEAVSSAKTSAGSKLRVGVMLPLHDIDGDGRRMVEYYRGVLMACDTLRSAGVSSDVYTWNVFKDADIRSILKDPRAKDLDIIFGPLYTPQVKPLADFCKENDIKLVIPFSINASDVATNDHVYQVYQTPAMLESKAIDAFLSRFKDYEVVVVDCNDSTSTKEPFVNTLCSRLRASGKSYRNVSLPSLKQDLELISAGLRPTVLIVNTSRSPELNLVFRALNELTEEEGSSLSLSMFGYTEWLMYESVYRELYHKYDVYIPSTFYYYKGLTRVASFENSYRRWFDEGMQERYIPRMGLTGFDQAGFFLEGLHERGSAFDGSPNSSTYKAVQTPLRFEHYNGDLGMQNTAFELVHYRTTGVIETISY